MFDFNRTAEGLKCYIAAMDQVKEITSRQQALQIMDNYFKYGDSGWTMFKFAQEADSQSIDMVAFIEEALDAGEANAQ